MARNKDSRSYIFTVAVVLCMACSVVVAGAAVTLRPMQQANRLLDQRANVLRVAGLYERGMDVNATFEDRIETLIVDLATGEEVDGIDPATYDMFQALRDPEQSVRLRGREDIAGLGGVPKRASVYVVRDEEGGVSKYVLPIAGYGLWSTMYGYLALESDANTIAGITFYDHGETPGLGGEIDNPAWQQQWAGKKVYDDGGDPAFGLIKGGADSDNEHGVDALSGATMTSNGVSNLMRFWFSDQAYKPFLERAAQG